MKQSAGLDEEVKKAHAQSTGILSYQRWHNEKEVGGLIGNLWLLQI